MNTVSDPDDGAADDAPAERARQAARQQNYPVGALYVIATPIGNLADISLRALECLQRVDAVAAEDTRVARQLLGHYGLDKPCFPVHQHNERASGATIVARLGAGERIAYISDAGTPAISDPGTQLVDAVHSAGLRVIPIPGVSAAICALSAAGLSDGPFHFAGFLPAKRMQAETVLRSLVDLPAQLVFYEAPHRIIDSLVTLAAVLGPARRVVIARELTKLFESIHRCTLGEARAWLEGDAHRVRGEFVLVVEGQTAPVDPLARALPVLKKLLEVLPLSSAVDLASELCGAPRKGLYAEALALKKAGDQ